MSFSFVEKVEQAILCNNIAIDTGFTIFWKKQHFRFGFKICKLLISISIVDDIRTISVLHGPVYHVFTDRRVIYSLWCPYSLQRFLAFEALLDINCLMRPMHKVFGF
ncbi:hypothetical protein D3C81_1524840 [compost metagenome]